MATTYHPSLFDRLINEEVAGRDGVRFRHSIEQVKDAVARDLESLLNATPAFAEGTFDDLPFSGKSILTFGLVDITSLSMSSDRDRRRIVESVQAALAAHEPRLRQVVVSVQPRERSGERLVLSIRGQLVLQPGSEPVAFDAVMQPGSTRYVVSRSVERAPGTSAAAANEARAADAAAA